MKFTTIINNYQSILRQFLFFTSYVYKQNFPYVLDLRPNIPQYFLELLFTPRKPLLLQSVKVKAEYVVNIHNVIACDEF